MRSSAAGAEQPPVLLPPPLPCMALGGLQHWAGGLQPPFCPPVHCWIWEEGLLLPPNTHKLLGCWEIRGAGCREAVFWGGGEVPFTQPLVGVQWQQ